MKKLKKTLDTAWLLIWQGTTLEALRWYRRAAEQGDPDAQNALGRMYEHGEGVAQNFALATKWYKLAAEHVPDYGAAGQGRNNLGMLYLEGHGVSKDYVQAYIWFRLSGLEANPNLSEAKAHMNPEQILEAERLVEAWKSQHTKPQ
jgi:TPR repeat protein